MHRRNFLRLGAAAAAPAARRPNILFALADDWGPGPAGALGDSCLNTPVFDRVAREGVLFTNTFVAAPTCTASRAAILTGQMPHRLGNAINLSSQWSGIPGLFTDLLNASGYHVGHTRKGWGPGETPGRELNPAGRKYRDFDEFLAARPADSPFFYWFGSNDPHRGYDPKFTRESGLDPSRVRVPAYLPDAPAVRADLADYCAEIQRFDSETGGLLHRLEQLGELENTLVVMTGDNGLPFPRAKGHLYDSGVHAPMALRWGARVAGGRRATDFVSFTDFAPTFLEVAGVAAPPQMTGRSFLNVLTAAGSGRIDARRDHVYTERERHTWCHPDGQSFPVRALRTDDHLLIWNMRPFLYPAGHPCLRREKGTPQGHVDCDEGPSKYFLVERAQHPEYAAFYRRAFGLRPEWELYDVRSDPDQLHNLASNPRHAAHLGKLQSRLRGWMKQTADPRAEGETGRWDGECHHSQPRADVQMPGYEEAQRASDLARAAWKRAKTL
ncbi:MAG: sulfatase [Acidobacteria bacterium]|nr:sulfatase [Acidobacteriota bacterium]